ncbi:transglycosylase domain-containing protein [Xylocopilactobacillus apis]|uniref:Penicillin-binding protein 1A n=1 Tax=Xylocopilactobacillus apis TaxID=2932183 RepID=A0AAU9D4T2_9LACO|nr:PBP1A family penicillin-binding protein [Xylocopilactobacillus apis]BDR56410.1 penicillin-binding protein 1A [Xylocopilactobacillus apis]
MKKIVKKTHPIKITFAVVLFFLVLISSFFTFKAKTADIKGMETSLRLNTSVYDKDNKYAGALLNRKGRYVNLDQISPNIVNAVINTEDRTFYKNPGFSVTGTARAVLGYVVHFGHDSSGGGSTISQQLVKNMFLTQKKTIGRKAEELFYSVQLNKVEPKKKILEMYLNHAYFGYGVWGVENASLRYFGVHASQVSVAQGAAICAMLANPGLYNPISYPDYAIKRRNVILNSMKANKVINESDYNQAVNEKSNITNNYTPITTYNFPSYFDAVIEEAKRDYKISEDDLLNDGYVIYTNLNQSMQRKMENYYSSESILPWAGNTQAQSASVAVNVKTGGVEALIGNANDQNHLFLELNRATQMYRQAGSTLKPISVYAPALTKGYKPDSMLQDKLVSYNGYKPKNYNNSYAGSVTMNDALTNSLNAPAVWLLNEIGLNTGVNSLNKFGFTVKENQKDLGLALGDLNVTPLQIAQAYQIIANNGLKHKTHLINRIETSNGKELRNFNDFSKPVISPKVVKELTPMLKNVFNNGTATEAKPSNFEVAGKTGSTQTKEGQGTATRDQWVVGYTPDICLTTWVGYDNPNDERVLNNSNYANWTFKNILESIYSDTPQTSFSDNSFPKERKKKDFIQSNIDLYNKGLDNLKNGVSSFYRSVIDFFK